MCSIALLQVMVTNHIFIRTIFSLSEVEEQIYGLICNMRYYDLFAYKLFTTTEIYLFVS